MPSLNFFTPVQYNNPDKSFLEYVTNKVDDYFYICGKKAYVIQGRTKNGKEKAILSPANFSLLASAAKVASYFSVVIPLLMLLTKAVLRSLHNYKVIDPKKKLEKGIDISEATIAKIQKLMPKITQLEKDKEFEWLSKGNNLVFKLAEAPNLVFKMARPNTSLFRGGKTYNSDEISEERFANMIKAISVCVANQLGLLVIPHAKKFEVEVDGKRHILIAEEALNFNPEESAQEEYYRKFSKELDETARQLAKFIALTGFNDVAWRNIPLLYQAKKGPMHVGLIDIEHMNSKVNGFTGDANGSRGLIRCVSDKQFDIVIDEARKQGIRLSDKDVKELKELRLKELKSDRELAKFHKKRGIIDGKEPLQVDVKNLGLDLSEKGEIRVLIGVEDGKMKWEKQTVTMKRVVEDVVSGINNLIHEQSNQASTKGKRYLLLGDHHEPFENYWRLGLSKGYVVTDEDEKERWINRIVQALVDKGYLFKLAKIDNYGYWVRA